MILRRWAVAVTAAASGAVMLAPADLSAEWALLQQTRQDAPAPAGAAGWVGLRVDFVASGAAQAMSGRYTVVVGEVVSGSPAAEVGLQAGDTLVLINGDEASPRSFDELRSGLRAGDPIRLSIRRDARRLDFDLVAGTRPHFVLSPTPGELEIRIDSVRTAIFRNADSLRRRAIVEAGQLALTVQTDSFATVLEVADDGTVRVGSGGAVAVIESASEDGTTQIRQWTFRFEGPGTPQAFESLVVHTPRTDSIRIAIQALRGELERVQRAQARREREGARQVVAVGAQDQTQDAALVQLRQVEAALNRRIQAQERALRELSRAELEAPPAADPAPVTWQEAPVVAPPRPITPYLVGRSYLAGARVTPINEGLAEYFGVEHGVLVTEVNPGTPAAEAGLLSGDVIVAVDGNAISDVGELRTALSSRWAGSRLTLTRRGEGMELELRR
jgi:membrane-associated protease RseP (regulator of RpoE activity)